jgi:H+-transporting ATPase
LEAATILSAVFQDWIDFGILVVVLIANACIGYFEEARAESALDALKNTLALKSRCWRNGKLVEVESSHLVPGDIISLRLGDIIPADCRLLGIGITGEIADAPLHIDQSGLTGESLPVEKQKGQTAYSSSIVKQGQMLGVVTKTGINTYIGRAANLISITTEEGHFQKIVNSIGNFLIIITCVSLLFKNDDRETNISFIVLSLWFSFYSLLWSGVFLKLMRMARLWLLVPEFKMLFLLFLF